MPLTQLDVLLILPYIVNNLELSLRNHSPHNFKIFHHIINNKELFDVLAEDSVQLRCAGSGVSSASTTPFNTTMLSTTGISRQIGRLIYLLSWLTLALISEVLPKLKVLIFDPNPAVSFCLALLLLLWSSILLPFEWNKRRRYSAKTNHSPDIAAFFEQATLILFVLVTIGLISKPIFGLGYDLFLLLLVLPGAFLFIIEPLLLIKKDFLPAFG
jgi:hypothetical protein